MKRTKFLKHLHEAGCPFVREGGNHTIYGSADGSRQSVVPRHSEIKPGLVRKICRDLNIDPPTEK